MVFSLLLLVMGRASGLVSASHRVSLMHKQEMLDGLSINFRMRYTELPGNRCHGVVPVTGHADAGAMIMN
jgi:hypothetical protein